jgi:thymidylate synthase
VVLELSEASCDDLLRESIEQLITLGEIIHPSKGQARELQGVTLELRNPRARLSRSETRGRIFSALGELCWYLSKSNAVEPISYYLSHYRTLGEGDKVFGGYGPRLFNFDGVDQISYVINKLREHPHSRQAVIQLFDHEDVVQPHKDVPCTCTFQFLLREGGLHLVTHMRSNDVYLGLSHDIFSFTMLQEIVARSIGASLGSYIHMVGSFHLYEVDMAKAKAFLAEGWQPGDYHMPDMPNGDPWPGIAHLLAVESRLRNGDDPVEILVSDEPYWADLERVLVIFSLVKAQRLVDAHGIRQSFSHYAYDVFATDRIDPL